MRACMWEGGGGGCRCSRPSIPTACVCVCVCMSHQVLWTLVHESSGALDPPNPTALSVLNPNCLVTCHAGLLRRLRPLPQLAGAGADPGSATVATCAGRRTRRAATPAHLRWPGRQQAWRAAAGRGRGRGVTSGRGRGTHVARREGVREGRKRGGGEYEQPAGSDLGPLAAGGEEYDQPAGPDLGPLAVGGGEV